MRDAISLLELCAGAHKEIDERLVFDTVGSGNRESAYKMVGAVGESDFDTVYSIIDDIVMKSGDLSVFWQEIIDTYRDIMVIKNSKNAQKYLDLTDMEYSAISSVAKNFSMAKLSYHITILESAMADMQRAFNSKRSIAEIALTRMCDAKTVTSIESLALRVEELEKSISMMKLGVPMTPVSEPVKMAKPSAPANVEKAKPAPINNDKKEKTVDNKEQNYSSWGYILERISELKHSLKSGLSTSRVYRRANTFTIYLNPVFYNILSSKKNDIELIRGLIAEKEKEPRENIVIELKPLETKGDTSFSDLDSF
jgi:DNA polymerase III gamma/tau subunit